MKTSVNMVRIVGGKKFLQRTKDGYFNATDLLSQWNKSNPDEKRHLDNFWKTTNLNRLMHEIAKNELDFNSVDFTVLKRELAKATKGKYGGTWMHPLLFVKFAMYLSPNFEYHVLKFVSDQLIDFRHDAGDNYTGLTRSVQMFQGINYTKLARGLNHIVFGRHEKDLRQKASEKQLKELTELQKKLAFAIDMGYIKTFDELLNEMRRVWHYKYNV